MQKGYKREGRGMAVLRCFIGLFIMIVLILLAYFLLKLDYSDKLEPGASVRPYVETTPSPEPSAAPEATTVPAVVADATEVPTDAPVATIAATATPDPTDAPTPEPTAEPTPEPTAIPDSAVAQLKFSGFDLPELSDKTAKLGITHSFRSAIDSNRYLHLQGYAYIDEADYDGAAASLYLVITRSTGHSALALPSRAVGVSGIEHADAQCQNPSSSDFDVVLDVSKFPDDSYTLGMVFTYKDAEGNSHREYCTFPANMSFSVLSGQAISDVKTVSE